MIIPIVGMSVCQSIKIGKVEFVHIDDNVINNIITTMEKVVLLTIHKDEEKKHIIENQISTIHSKFKNSVCSFVRVIAEPNRAKEIAETETQRALDILRFSIPAIYPPSHNIAIGLWGEVSRDSRMSLVLSDSHFSRDNQVVGYLQPFKIDSEHIEQMEKFGVFKFSQILTKPDQFLTDFEKTLLRSLHWFANSLRQYENENAFLNLITSIETLLTPRDGNPIGTAIAEGCAFLLSKDISSRKRVKKRIKELYGLRSGVAHGGKKEIFDIDLIELRAYWMAILSKMSSMSKRWNTQKDFFEWIEDQKFESNTTESGKGESFSPPPHITGHAGPHPRRFPRVTEP